MPLHGLRQQLCPNYVLIVRIIAQPWYPVQGLPIAPDSGHAKGELPHQQPRRFSYVHLHRENEKSYTHCWVEYQ